MSQDIPRQTIKRLIRELDHAPKKGPVMEKWTERLGCSKSTLYKRLREVRGKTKDTSGRTREVDRDLVRAVLRLKERSKSMGRADAERELSTEECLKILEREGWEGATDHSPSRINAIAREELGYRDRSRARRFEADYPTQLYQMDFSRLEYWQVFDYDDEEEDYLLKNTKNSTAYKDPSGAFRAWIIGLIDDRSRLALGRVFAATGESPELGLEFLHWVFSRDNDEHPLRYLPETLQVDAGAFDAEASRRAMEAAGVELKGGMGKGSQGKIERNFRTLWQKFELKLAADHKKNDVFTLTEFNTKLHEFCTRQCREPHPQYRRHTREEVFSAGLPGHARTLDADLLSLAFNVRERTVKNDGTVPVDNVDYDTPPETSDGVRIEPGDKVRVMESLDGHFKARLVEKAHADPFELTPFEPNSLEDFSGHEGPTMQERLRDQVDLSQPVGHVLQDTLSGQDLVEAATDGRLEMPDVIPRPTPVVPDSPFHDGPPDEETSATGQDGKMTNGEMNNDSIDPDAVEPEETEAMPAREARRYIGRRLRPEGLTYADVSDLFDDLLGEAARSEIDELLYEIFRELPEPSVH